MFSDKFRIALFEEIFKDGDEWHALHDIILEVTGAALGEAAAHLVFFQLPETIQCDALKWGLSDTEVRDDIYTHLMKKVKDDE